MKQNISLANTKYNSCEKGRNEPILDSLFQIQKRKGYVEGFAVQMDLGNFKKADWELLQIVI